LLKDKLTEKANNITIDRQLMQNKAKLISFLYYNFANTLEKSFKERESKAIYKKGFEFSLAMLGELCMNTLKFKRKMSHDGVPMSSINYF
jgi:hypothetical protein